MGSVSEYARFGPEALAVSKFHIGYSVQPAVVRLPSGGFLFAADLTNVAGYYERYILTGQLFDSEGDRVGESFHLSPDGYRPHQNPDLVALSNGSTVVTFSEGHISHGSHIHVRGENFYAYATSGSNVYRDSPEITVLQNGNLVVTYTDNYGTANPVTLAKIMSPSGTVLAGPIEVSRADASTPTAHELKALAGGGFAIAQPRLSDTGTGLDVVIRIYDQSGVKTSEFVANTNAAGDQFLPAMDVSPSGNIILVWQDNNVTGDGSGSSVKAQIFDAAGNKIGGEILVNQTTAGNQGMPSVLALSSGGFVVSWTDDSQIGGDSDGFGIKAQAFDANGNKVGEEFLVNTSTSGDQTAPILVETAYGRFAIIWTDSIEGIKFQLFSPGEMVGTTGNDTYFVDDASDVVVEGANGGNDTIFAGVSYILSDDSHVEVLSTANHSATTAIDLAGNIFANTLFGNAGNNVLNGRGGADLLIGFGGNDIYSVDNSGDVIVEAEGQGTDTVFTSIDFTLAGDAHVEVISAISHGATTPLSLTGNAFGNTIYGNAGNNTLNGGGGADFLIGFGGNDIYYVDHVTDYIVEAEGQGHDTLFSSIDYALTGDAHVEVLSTMDHAATTAINLSGNMYANTIWGNAGANVLNGGAGADVLIGFAGADRFVFSTALGGGNIDTISDFAAGVDKIALSSAIFSGLAPGALQPGAFNTGAWATQADDRIIYNPNTGALLFDADGVGGADAIHFASISPNLALGATDFIIL
jgi:Ca2+-binding RTX toxin-like protein